MAAVSARRPKAPSEAGQILVIAALSMLAIIGGVALVLEGGNAYANQRIAQGFRRDERTLGLMFVVPIVVTALLGWVLRCTTDPVVDVVMVNTHVDNAAALGLYASLGFQRLDQTLAVMTCRLWSRRPCRARRSGSAWCC